MEAKSRAFCAYLHKTEQEEGDTDVLTEKTLNGVSEECSVWQGETHP
jgi:hypothetical protein